MNEFSLDKPGVKADYNYWAKMELWSIDEAVALLLERDPRVVSWENVQYYYRNTDLEFPKEYSDLLEILERARVSGRLLPANSPVKFLEWAQSKDIEVPEELLAAVDDVVDWNKAYCKLKESFDRLESDFESTVADLKVKIERLESKSPSTRERDSLLKLALAMAVRKYGYRPGDTRSPATGKIKTALDNCGLSMDDQTILKYLREAAERFPLDGER